MSTTWNHCLDRLEVDLPPVEFNTWIRPLHAVEDGPILRLLAPNHFVSDQVSEHFLDRIRKIIRRCESAETNVTVHVGSRGSPSPVDGGTDGTTVEASLRDARHNQPSATGLRAELTFDNFVEGKSNQMARAASMLVASSPHDTDNNPLLIYGGTGVGKTHLMHATGNRMLEENPSANVVYLHSEQFVAEMVTALQHRNKIDQFKKRYRSVDALLIDDIQFFAGKERSQEEFFHTFNRLLERKSFVVLTSDQYPKEIDGLENRLKTRFGGGLPIAIDPPELETRAAILMNKAAVTDTVVPDEVAFFIAQLQSNLRELEGALRRVIANAKFTGRAVTVDMAKDVLRDIIESHKRLVTIENIQRTVSEYFKIRVNDLTSRRKSRSVTRPRHIAMALAKELTKHSLPEIGAAFGGRDHTTVLYACRKIAKLREQDVTTADDYNALLRILTT